MRRPAVQLLLRCDRRGRVLATLGGDAALLRLAAPGMTLAPLVADAGAAPLLDFLFTLRRAGAAVSGELAAADGRRPLHLAGLVAGEGTLVAGDRDAARLARFCRSLLATPGLAGEPSPGPATLSELGRLLDEAGPEPEGDEVESLRRTIAEQEEAIARLKAELAKPRKRSAS